MTTASDTDTTRAHLRGVLADLAGVVDGVTDRQLDAPTPCVDDDVAHLLEHVMGWLTTFAEGFVDPGGRAPRSGLDGYRPPPATGDAVRSATELLDAALVRGAAARSLVLGEAAMPGAMALSMVLAEYQIHGWDLAVATGQPWAPVEDGLEESLAFLPAMLTEDYQGEGKPFGPRVEVDTDASPLARLLALSGRDPGWTPPR